LKQWVRDRRLNTEYQLYYLQRDGHNGTKTIDTTLEQTKSKKFPLWTILVG
jgi:hypothetical protein